MKIVKLINVRPNESNCLRHDFSQVFSSAFPKTIIAQLPPMFLYVDSYFKYIKTPQKTFV